MAMDLRRETRPNGDDDALLERGKFWDMLQTTRKNEWKGRRRRFLKATEAMGIELHTHTLTPHRRKQRERMMRVKK